MKQLTLCDAPVDPRRLADLERTLLEAAARRGFLIVYRFRGFVSLAFVPAQWRRSAGRQALSMLERKRLVRRSRKGLWYPLAEKRELSGKAPRS